MSEAQNGWTTALTSIQPNEIRVRGYRLDDLMGQVSFAQMVLLILTGELPSADAADLLDAMLVASIDHGATPPSTLAARTVASTGAPLGAAVAAGLLSINRYHGGAIEDCASMIRSALDNVARAHADVAEVARGVVADYQGRRAVIPGLGHRFHTDDPRTARLFEMAEQRGIAADGVRMLGAIQGELAAQRGRMLPLNVDGAIAALLVDLGLPAGTGNALFMIARLPGLVAHVVEENTRQRPMRVVDPTNHSYDGPPPRTVPTTGATTPPG